MIPKMDPKQMAKLMSQMGIKNEPVDAAKVVIEKNDGNVIVIENPQVTKITMQGQASFQVSGEVLEEAKGAKKAESDVEIIMRECNCTREQAEKALKESNGDLADAILKLSG